MVNKVMNNLFLCFCVWAFCTGLSFAQDTPMGPAEKKMTDSVCKCVNLVDLKKISTREEAIAAYTNCITKNADIMMSLVDERKADINDKAAMTVIGVDLAKNLLKTGCENFAQLSLLTTKGTGAEAKSVTTGTFKRIDVKGFNYIVLKDAAGNEQSFLWLRQFPGSEQFAGSTLKLAGKPLKVTWQEMEVYLPAAKGYYKVKEITAIEGL
ncbi:hypothetical protein [Hufsiella ginkgonis]|uniref:Uncharacterized protein n=1 Tax=Hufsiella ginkgonis TaxID=2695274 RepID=A0A7K1XUH5_9SPHI|nr:hypothetical protein [Hufsiella ginkgonis]MXV14665.1 hypothetical protein [Hufsiella ginkgonis]